MTELLLVLKEAGMVFPIILGCRQQLAVLVYWSSSWVEDNIEQMVLKKAQWKATNFSDIDSTLLWNIAGKTIIGRAEINRQ